MNPSLRQEIDEKISEINQKFNKEKPLTEEDWAILLLESLFLEEGNGT